MGIKFSFKNIIVIISLLLIVSGGCSISKERKEQKIEGTWEMVNVWDPSDPDKEQWRFDKVEDGIGTVTWIKIVNGTSTVSDNGSYSIEAKTFSSYLNLAYGVSSHGLSGRWEIAKLNKEILIITQKSGGIITREFFKVD
ncbi:MAG: hypothetical protein ABII90_13990 [Bacteroidota bacterium]